MKYTLILIVCLFKSFTCFSQSSLEKGLSHSIHLDTVLTPDYYQVKIGVAEFLTYKGRRRNGESIVVPLDTVIKKLEEELKRLGFKQILRKVSIVEKANQRYTYYYSPNNKNLFQANFEFEVGSSDSIEYLFQNINKQMLELLIVTPKLNASTLETAEKEIILRGMLLGREFTQKIAEVNKQKIIKQSNYHIAFEEVPNVIGNDAYNNNKEFSIDFRNHLEYSLNITFTYLLEDL